MPEPRSAGWQVLEGMSVALGLLFALFFFTYAVLDTWADWGPNGPLNDWTNTPLLLLAYCGLSQVVYVVPCYLFFRKKNMVHLAKGLLLGAALILVTNLLVYEWWSHS